MPKSSQIKTDEPKAKRPAQDIIPPEESDTSGSAPVKKSGSNRAELLQILDSAADPKRKKYIKKEPKKVLQSFSQFYKSPEVNIESWLSAKDKEKKDPSPSENYKKLSDMISEHCGANSATYDNIAKLAEKIQVDITSPEKPKEDEKADRTNFDNVTEDTDIKEEHLQYAIDNKKTHSCCLGRLRDGTLVYHKGGRCDEKPFWTVLANGKIHLYGIYAHENSDTRYKKIERAVEGPDTIEITGKNFLEFGGNVRAKGMKEEEEKKAKEKEEKEKEEKEKKEKEKEEKAWQGCENWKQWYEEDLKKEADEQRKIGIMEKEIGEMEAEMKERVRNDIQKLIITKKANWEESDKELGELEEVVKKPAEKEKDQKEELKNALIQLAKQETRTMKGKLVKLQSDLKIHYEQRIQAKLQEWLSMISNIAHEILIAEGLEKQE